MRRLILIPLLVVAALAVAGGPSANPKDADVLQAKIDENSRKLSDLQAVMQEVRARQQGLDEREAEIRRGHAAVLEEIELSGRLLVQMDERERLLAQQREDLKGDLSRSERHYQASREALSEHLRAMYIRGKQGSLESILTTGSFSQFVIRSRYEALLARLGAGLVDGTREEGRQLNERRRKLEVSLAEISRIRQDAAGERGRREELLAEQMASLRDLEEERREVGERLLELSMNEQRLNYVLSDLEELRARRQAENATVASNLVDMAGNLEWPVQGELLRGFGRSVHPRFQTVTLNNGVNIQAGLGSPVAAVAGGQVEFCDRLPGFGRCVILDHGAGYYTLYAHLDRVFVSPGGQTAPGQVIAEVGKPESGGPAQLYFEIRQGKTPLNPVDWLRSR